MNSSEKPINNNNKSANSREDRQFTFKIIKRRSPWTSSEDNAIISLVQKHGTGNWTVISNEMSSKFNFKNRSGKQCRERWHNHLDPKVNKNYWDEKEENVLFEKHMELGNKWSDIAKFLPGRTDNSIKNHFYSKLRKYIRRILKQINKENLMKNFNIDSNKYNSDKIYKLLKRSKISYKNLNKETILSIITNNEKNGISVGNNCGTQSGTNGRLRLRKYTNYKVGKKKNNEAFYGGNNNQKLAQNIKDLNNKNNSFTSKKRKRTRKRKVSISLSTPEYQKKKKIKLNQENTHIQHLNDSSYSSFIAGDRSDDDYNSIGDVDCIHQGFELQEGSNIIIDKKIISNENISFGDSSFVIKPIPLINTSLLPKKSNQEVTQPFQEQSLNGEENKTFSFIKPQLSPVDLNTVVIYPQSTRNSFNLDFKGGMNNYLIHTPKVVTPSIVINNNTSPDASIQAPSIKEKKPQIDINLINNAFTDNSINLSPISAFIPKKIE